MLISELVKNPTDQFLSALEKQAEADSRHVVVDCIILDEQNRIFIQKRSPERRLYPNMWEPPGGHVDAGENLWLTIEREIKEETNLDLKSIKAYLGSSDWEVKPEWQKAGDNPQKRSFVFAITAEGDLHVEIGKVTDYEYVDEEAFDHMVRQGEEIDEYIIEIMRAAFAFAKNLVK